MEYRTRKLMTIHEALHPIDDTDNYMHQEKVEEEHTYEVQRKTDYSSH